MQFKKAIKKGFTLVELVVVIAVIAILAATSVGIYFGVTESAKKSNDQTVTNQMNKTLLLDETVNGKPATVTEVLSILDENGFDATKMSPFQDGAYYLWDSKENEMILVDNENNVQFPEGVSLRGAKHEYFTFVASKTEKETYAAYSVYLKDGYVGDENEVFTTGVDVGNNYGKDVIYEGANEVTIRTNNGDLTVKTGIVNHYGAANYLKVESGAKYNEFGTVVGNLDEIPTISNESEYVKVNTEEDLRNALNVGGKIMLTGDISVTVSDADDVNVFTVSHETEINLNGHNIEGLRDVSFNYEKSNALFAIKAPLTLSGYGVVSYEQKGNNMGWNGYMSVCSVQQSVLNVEDAVIIRNIGGTDMAYAIDVLTNGTLGDATLNINGGLVESLAYIAVRAFCNSTSNSVYVTVTDGIVRSMKSIGIWFQNPNSNNNNGSLTISGGTIISETREPILIGSSTNFSTNYTGGTFIEGNADVTSQYVK